MKIKPLVFGLCLPLAILAKASNAQQLSDVIQTAIASNPEVRAAENEVSARKYEERGAQAGYLPTLDVAAGIGRESTFSSSTAGNRRKLTREEASASVRQLVFDGFATRSEVRRQRARKESAVHILASTKADIALRTSEVYLSILIQADLMHLAESSLTTHNSIFDRIVLRNQSGISNLADVNQIAARVALAESNVIVAQANLLDAVSNYYRVVGVMPEVEKLVAPNLKINLPSNFELAVEQAIATHPTLQQANADIKATNAQYKAAAAPFYPDVRIEADASWNTDIDGIAGRNDDQVLAIRMRYNLYRGGADKARRKQTSYLLEESKDVRNSTLRQVIEGIRLSWSAHQSISAQMPYLKQHVDAADATKKAYEEQFNLGQGRTLLDLLNTENEVVESKRNLIQAISDQKLAKIRVRHSIGNLLQSLPQ